MAKQIGNTDLIDTWASEGNIVDPDPSKKEEGWLLGEQPPHEWMNHIQNEHGQKINRLLDDTYNEETGLNRRVIYVDTVADLQALDTSGLESGQVSSVAEYNPGTGMGGGQFFWEPGSDEPEDGIVVFGSSKAGRWVRNTQGNYRKLSWSGAVGGPEECASSFLVDTVNSLELGLHGVVELDPIEWYFSDNAYLERGDLTLYSNGAKVICHNPDQFTEPRDGTIFVGDVNFRPDAGIDTIVTSDIKKENTVVSVQDSSMFSENDFVRILSGTDINDGEWFFGIEDSAGNRATKSEINQIQHIVDGTTIVLANPACQDYDATNFNVHVDRCLNLSSVSVKGIYFKGKEAGPYGQGSSSLATNYPRGLVVKGCSNVSIQDCTFFNHPRYGLHVDFAYDVTVTGNKFLGQDFSEAEEKSDWFTGSNFIATSNMNFSNNTAKNCRRIIDFHGSGFSPVSRDCLVTGNVSTGCIDAVGSHVSDRISYIGNSGYRCIRGIYYRGRNGVIMNNYFEVYERAIQFGDASLSGTKKIQDKPFNIGKCVVSNNEIRFLKGFSTSVYISAKCDWDELIIKNNNFTGVERVTSAASQSLIFLNGFYMKKTRIVGNNFDNTRMGDDFVRTIDFANYSDARTKVLKDVVISNNVFNTHNDAVRVQLVLSETQDAEPMDFFVIKNNVFINANNRNIQMTRGEEYLMTNMVIIKDNVGYGDPGGGHILADEGTYLEDGNLWDEGSFAYDP